MREFRGLCTAASSSARELRVRVQAAPSAAEGLQLGLNRVGGFLDNVAGINELSPGEERRFPGIGFKVEKVQLVDRFSQGSPGTLYVTTTHLIFIAEAGGAETWLLHSCLATVERGALTAAGVALVVRSKTFHALHFLIPRDKDATDLLTTLLQLSRPTAIEHVYAFSYIPEIKEMKKKDGWDLFPMEMDFIRQGLPNDNWVQTDFNLNYEHCDTYPRTLWVPAKVTKQLLIGSSKFRSRGRLPVLTYFHEPTQASVSRCSQPLSGFSARCEEDERMLTHHRQANPNCGTLYVVDTRPRLNAMANKAQGKGFEDEKNYPGIRFHFLNIENIHVMRNSLAKLCEVSSGRGTGMSGFWGGLESSGWLKHVKAVLEAGVFVADSVSRGISCLVHCSDGWDRTAQTCALAALLLDPHYRTLQGFLALIERDWLGFGHKFSDRCAHTVTATGGGTNDQDDAAQSKKEKEASGVSKEFSPVFTQWLDAVWQCMRQFPAGFEFNERFLLELHDHVHSCQFGTFLGNCDKDRQDLRLSSRTFSLWAYILRRRSHYVNPLYSTLSGGEKGGDLWKVDLRPQSLVFWRSLYNRHEGGVHPRESAIEEAEAAATHMAVLTEHLGQLQRRLGELKGGEGMGDSGHSSCADDAPKAAGKPWDSGESGIDVRGGGGGGGALYRLGISPSLASLDLSAADICDTHLNSVAVRWQSLRGNPNLACNSCGTTLPSFRLKEHCVKCGRIHCTTCLAEVVEGSLPGLSPSRETTPPLCKPCAKDLSLAMGDL